MRETVFIDRDGVICENRSDYVKSWSEFVFLPNVFEPLAALKQAGYRVVIVTNQSAVGRGLMTVEVLQDIHNRMKSAIHQHGGHIDEIIYCPHIPEDNCDCRKPRPGMLLSTAQKFQIDLSQSYMIGDARTDVEAGQAVGCRSFLVLTGRGWAEFAAASRSSNLSFYVVSNLAMAVRHILDSGSHIPLESVVQAQEPQQTSPAFIVD